MKYVEILTEAIRPASKLIVDLVNLLDHPLCQLEGTKESYGLAEMATLREEVFHDFCALCLQSGLGVPPPMERILLVAQAPDHDEKSIEAHKARIKNFIEPAVFKLGQMKTIGTLSQERLTLAFLEVLRNLPGLSEYSSSSVTAKQIECLINLMLMDQLIDPIRPDYQTREVKAVNMAGPKRELNVLIVDDDMKALFKTARALAGWENLKILFYHFTSEKHIWDIKEEEKSAELSNAAKAIWEIDPDVILMDQGLGPIDGSDLIPVIDSIAGVYSPIFVANTDGSDEKLRNAGALEN